MITPIEFVAVVNMATFGVALLIWMKQHDEQ